jgi:hypothetical protein
MNSIPNRPNTGTNLGQKNSDISLLMRMVRNRASQEDNRNICKECLRQTHDNAKDALNLLKNIYQKTGQVAPSESVKTLLRQETPVTPFLNDVKKDVSPEFQNHSLAITSDFHTLDITAAKTPPVLDTMHLSQDEEVTMLTEEVSSLHSSFSEDSTIGETEKRKVLSTLNQTSILLSNINDIIHSDNPIEFAMKLINLSIEDGFKKGMSALEIIEPAKAFVKMLRHENKEVAILLFRDSDPCFTGRMACVQEFLQQQEIGSIEIENNSDVAIAMNILENLYDFEFTTDPKTDRTELDKFIHTLPPEVQSHLKFNASLNAALEGYDFE